MILEPYVADAYALLAWLVEGRPSYGPYFQHMQQNRAYVSPQVLMEFYFMLFHNHGKDNADRLYSFVTPFLIVLSPHEDYIKEAAQFRSAMIRQKKRLSYTDSLNCVMARRLKTKVLTGDSEMKGLAEVEFVQ